MQGIKLCSITTARKNNRISNKFESARTMALALLQITKGRNGETMRCLFFRIRAMIERGGFAFD